MPITLKVLRPRDVLPEPQTVGDHIKRCRLERGLTQKQAGFLMGFDPFTILNWEKNRTEPPTTAYPAIVNFLGYDPSPTPQTLPERLKAKRRAMGWTIKEAAEKLGVDECTWGTWERGHEPPWPRYRALLESFLRDTP